MSVEDVHCKTDFGNTKVRVTGKDIIKIAINLVIIYVIGGVILAFVYAKAAPIIYIKQKEEKEVALKTMMPEADSIESMGIWEPHHKKAEYYIAKKGNEEIGYVVEGFGKGYSSYINILVSVDKNFVVKKVSVISHAETPGLGDEILKSYFLDQFKGKDVEHLVVIKGETENEIEAISGATISSRAVAEDGVRNSIKMLIDKFSGGVKG